MNRIICLGDSLTAAIPDAELDKWVTRLALSLDGAYPQRFSVFSRGYNGATSAAGLERIESEVSYLLPALMLVEFGGNDALVRPWRKAAQVGVEEFKNNLREIHRYFSAKNSPVVFIAMHYPEPDHRKNMDPAQMYIPGNQKTSAENYQPYHHAILSIGDELNVPVIDMPKALEERGFKTSDLVMEDGLHLTTRGNAVYAEVIFDLLKKILDQNP